MNIESLNAGQPFYILRKGEKPVLEIGTVKSKSQPRAKFPTATPMQVTLCVLPKIPVFGACNTHLCTLIYILCLIVIIFIAMNNPSLCNKFVGCPS